MGKAEDEKHKAWKKKQQGKIQSGTPTSFVGHVLWLVRLLVKLCFYASIASVIAGIATAEIMNTQNVARAHSLMLDAEVALNDGLHCDDENKQSCKIFLAKSHDNFAEAMDLYHYAMVKHGTKSAHGASALLRLLRMPGLQIRAYLSQADPWIEVKERLRAHMQKGADAWAARPEAESTQSAKE